MYCEKWSQNFPSQLKSRQPIPLQLRYTLRPLLDADKARYSLNIRLFPLRMIGAPPPSPWNYRWLDLPLMKVSNWETSKRVPRLSRQKSPLVEKGSSKSEHVTQIGKIRHHPLSLRVTLGASLMGESSTLRGAAEMFFCFSTKLMLWNKYEDYFWEFFLLHGCKLAILILCLAC